MENAMAHDETTDVTNGVQNTTASTLSFNSIESNGKECDDGWTLLEERCFKVIRQERAWRKAEQKCIELGGHLASITSGTLSEAISNLTMMGNAIRNPSTAFWIGATDSDYENAFTWSSGMPFFYSDWFPGWHNQNHYSSQPSDDGLGNEDCVELRRTFRLATKGIRVTSRMFWNDRNCQVLNQFICEKLKMGDDFTQERRWTCNKTLTIPAGAPSTLVTSSGFPLSYPSSLNCITKLKTFPGATLTIFFDVFVLEDHPRCDFDRLEIREPETGKGKVLCGDWTGKLKLLRYQSSSTEVLLTLRSDPAHTFAGFKLRVTATMGGSGCGTNWQIRQGSTCLLAANSPQVTWLTASRICNEAQGELASLDDEITLSWLNTWLHTHPRFTVETRYWIGGQLRGGAFVWEDGKPIQREVLQNHYSHYGQKPRIQMCLSVEESTPQQSDRPLHYAQPAKRRMRLAVMWHFCDGFGGYICSKKVKESPFVINRTILGSEGNVTTPGYPRKYPNDVDMTVNLEGPPSSRLVLFLSKMSLEFQRSCLYDYIGLQDGEEKGPMLRFCGHHPTGMKKLMFVSKTNTATLTFHSDWSQRGAGAVVDWKAIDVKGCPFQEKEAGSVVMSPNYPSFNLPNLECTTVIKAPEGQRVWLQFETFEISRAADEERKKETKETPRHFASWANPSSISEYSALSKEFAIIHSPYVYSDSNRIPTISASSSIPSFPNISSSSTTSSNSFSFSRYNASLTLAKHIPLYAYSAPTSSQAWLRESQSGKWTFVPVPLSRSPVPPASSNKYNHVHTLNGKRSCEMDFVEVHLSENEKLRLCGIYPKNEVQNLAFISHGNILKLFLRTSDFSRGRGFRAHYKIGRAFNEEAIIKVKSSYPEVEVEPEDGVSSMQSEILPLNFPHLPPSGVKFTRHLFAPLGNRLTINLHNVGDVAPQGDSCPQNYLEIEDWYGGTAGTVWKICSFKPDSKRKISLTSTFSSIFIREVYPSQELLRSQILDDQIKKANYQESKNNSSVSSNIDLKKQTNEDIFPETDQNNTIIVIPESSHRVKKNTMAKSALNILTDDKISPLELESVDEFKNISTNHSDEENYDVDLVSDVKNYSSFIIATGMRDITRVSFLSEAGANKTITKIHDEMQGRYSGFHEMNNNYTENKIPFHAQLPFKISYSLIPDPDWINRSIGLTEGDDRRERVGVASCQPSPCIHEERCVTHGLEHTCLCLLAYTGIFCQVHWCDVEPCMMGKCQSNGPQSSFTCNCESGWGGELCDKKISPCAKQPCQGRGECSVVNNTFSCRCHAWWKGARCQNRIKTIPFQPLSQRMFKEPFWLGLITVAIVMCCIGIVFCIKKHFADKIEKFFAEEIERSKYGGVSGSRPNPLPSPTGLSPRPRPKSLLVRLNSFRKSSLLSLSSTASSPVGEGSSYLLDDLLKPHKRGGGGGSSPRRHLVKSHSQTVSPRIDAKKIIRHLVAPPVANRAPSFDDFLNLDSQSAKCSVISNEYRRLRSASPEVPSHFNYATSSTPSSSLEVERTHSVDISELCAAGPPSDRRASGGDTQDMVQETSLISLAPSPSKQDKKVTFAKLMEKMQKELSSSSSDISAAEEKSLNRGVAVGGVVINGAVRRSPRRSPRLKYAKRSSNSGSEDVAETPDISSSEMTPDPPNRLLSIKSSSSPSSKTSSPQNRSKLKKISSADSLLAMFKSFGGTARFSSSSPTSPQASEMDDSSAQASPSTTPTTPTKIPASKDTLLVPGALQVQVHGQLEACKTNTPAITLEVPSEQYRCLSPITELPTPMPTPMPSPLPTPSRYHNRQMNTNSESSAADNTTEDTESEFSINISAERSSSDSSGSEPRAFFSGSKHSCASTSKSSYRKGDSLVHLVKNKTIPKISLPLNVTSSPMTSPTSSPKVKMKPPPIMIPNSNLLNFTKSNEELNFGILPVIRIQDEEGSVLDNFDSTPRTRSQSVDVGNSMKPPLITVCCFDEAHPSTASSSSKSDDSTSSFVVPTLSVTIASPPTLRKNIPIIPDIKIDGLSYNLSSKDRQSLFSRKQLTHQTQINTNNFPQPPKITVTTAMSEVESDLDTPLEKSAPTTTTARYLSPLLVTTIQATSDGNLSSSGYSSAYSPGPSRCSSNNRLSSGETEEPLTPSLSSIPSKSAILCNNKSWTKRSSFAKLSEDSSKIEQGGLIKTDSETTDDPEFGVSSQPEQDSALELDTNDEYQDNGNKKNKPLHHTISVTDINDEAVAQRRRLLMSSSHSFPKESNYISKSNPAIVNASLPSDSSLEESTCNVDKFRKISPPSSRSESPISDSRLSIHRVYPAFFSNKGKFDLPYTDSDGLYDFPSSEVLHSDSSKQIPVRRHGKRKLKNAHKLKNFISPNDHKVEIKGEESNQVLSLELPTWEHQPSRKSNHKRRPRNQKSVDLLSSSSESFTSHSATGECPSPLEILSDIGCQDIKDKHPTRIRKSPGKKKLLMRGESVSCRNLRRQNPIDYSEEEFEEQSTIKTSKVTEDLPRHKKISRIRGFGNQLRFLRRLQQSRSPREHLVTASDSSDSDLDQSSPPRREIQDFSPYDSPKENKTVRKLKENRDEDKNLYNNVERNVRSS